MKPTKTLPSSLPCGLISFMSRSHPRQRGLGQEMKSPRTTRCQLALFIGALSLFSCSSGGRRQPARL